MIQIDVCLPSGKETHFTVSQSSKVGDIRILSQRYFGQGFLRLVNPRGQALPDTDLLLEADLQEGEHLTAIALEIKISATNDAFALWCCGGNQIVTWGSRDAGGDNSALHGQFRNVKQVQAAKDGAFAAILADGSVVTWGDPSYGGDSSPVQPQLQNVQYVVSTYAAFAAILADGSVVTWGFADSGGDSSAVQDQLLYL